MHHCAWHQPDNATGDAVRGVSDHASYQHHSPLQCGVDDLITSLLPTRLGSFLRVTVATHPAPHHAPITLRTKR